MLQSLPRVSHLLLYLIEVSGVLLPSDPLPSPQPFPHPTIPGLGKPGASGFSLQPQKGGGEHGAQAEGVQPGVSLEPATLTTHPNSKAEELPGWLRK